MAYERRVGRRSPRGDNRGMGHHDSGGPLRWLLTYADMITLLMAFFIMMYSMSALDLEKFSLAADSLRQEFGESRMSEPPRVLFRDEAGGRLRPSLLPLSLGLGGTSSYGPDASAMAVLQDMVSFQQLRQYLQANHLDHQVRPRVERRGFVVSLLADGLLFPAASAQMTGNCRGILARLAGVLRDLPNDVCVEGHTCDLPPRGTGYPSNWELSTARATQVARYFIEVQRIPAHRLSAAGYASSKPLVPNTCERNRILNRRVDIVILGDVSR